MSTKTAFIRQLDHCLSMVGVREVYSPGMVLGAVQSVTVLPESREREYTSKLQMGITSRRREDELMDSIFEDTLKDMITTEHKRRLSEAVYAEVREEVRELAEAINRLPNIEPHTRQYLLEKAQAIRNMTHP